MDFSAAARQKWTLTPDALEAFLRYLDADRERAGAQYEQIRRKLLTFFRCNGCWNGEELVDETLDRVIRRLSEVEVRCLMPFIRGVARHLVFEHHKRAKEVPLTAAAEPPHPGGVDQEREEEMDRRLRCLRESVPRLDPPDQELVLAWYVYEKSDKIANTRRLAAARGTSPATLRVQAHRARRRLQHLVEDCLKKQSESVG
jgi:DNA-directed RNA polymerase specialized sigma24 family protein